MTKTKEAKFEEKWHREVGDADDNPLAALDEAVKEAVKGEDPPAGAFSVTDLAKRYHMSERRAYELRNALMAEGKIALVGVYHGKKHYAVVK